MQPPAFLGTSKHVYDLSVLVDGSKVAELAPQRAARWKQELEAVSLLHSDAFPTAALTALTTLDPDQIASLKVHMHLVALGPAALRTGRQRVGACGAAWVPPLSWNILLTTGSHKAASSPAYTRCLLPAWRRPA